MLGLQYSGGDQGIRGSGDKAMTVRFELHYRVGDKGIEARLGLQYGG